MDFDKIGPLFVGIVSGIIMLAIISVVLSQKANTPQVLQAGGSALSAILNAAVSPITGSAGGFGTGGA